MKRVAALEKNQKDTKYFEETKTQHRVNLNDLINRKKEEEKYNRKTSIKNYFLVVTLALLVVLVYYYIK